MEKSPFGFEYSYCALPEILYSRVWPTVFPKAETYVLNYELAEALGLELEEKSLASWVFSDRDVLGGQPFAQAYAGHQFGHFTKLGDGRAMVLGELRDAQGRVFDVQLKGGGLTPYSRGGDGLATLPAMLREYLVSRAMQGLGIATSKTLALFVTGEPVFRQQAQHGAAILRVMKSHIRVGTFEFAAQFASPQEVKLLTDYTVARLYPELLQEANLPLSLFRKVMREQIDLVVQWMRVGFIHGVMNTDNVSISAETFDYGPCAFMNVYDPKTVYSSIDHQGRYAFGNQPHILKWNLARFAEALLPIMHTEAQEAIALAQASLDEFDGLWQDAYYAMMLQKLGFGKSLADLYPLVDALLALMEREQLDYTQTFWGLGAASLKASVLQRSDAGKMWLKSWHKAVETHGLGSPDRDLMRRVNPYVIPRNHLVEKALQEASQGDLSFFYQFLRVLENPYDDRAEFQFFDQSSPADFEGKYQTFCGT